MFPEDTFEQKCLRAGGLVFCEHSWVFGGPSPGLRHEPPNTAPRHLPSTHSAGPLGDLPETTPGVSCFCCPKVISGTPSLRVSDQSSWAGIQGHGIGALPSPQFSEPLPSMWLLFQQAWGWAIGGTSPSSLSFLICKMEATNPMRVERDGMEDMCGKLCPWSGHLVHVVSPSYR